MNEKRPECWLGDVLRACAVLDGVVGANGEPNVALVERIAELVLPVSRPAERAISTMAAPSMAPSPGPSSAHPESAAAASRGPSAAPNNQPPDAIVEVPTQLVERRRSEAKTNRLTTPRARALVVGIDKYAERELATAVRAARSFARTLTASRPRGPLVSPAALTLLIDGDATRTSLRRALDEIRDAESSFDRFIFYFAGHIVDDSRGQLALLTADSSEASPSLIVLDEMRESLGTAGPREQLFFIDGVADEDLKQRRAIAARSARGSLAGRSQAVLFAAHPDVKIADDLSDLLDETEGDTSLRNRRVTMQSIEAWLGHRGGWRAGMDLDAPSLEVYGAPLPAFYTWPDDNVDQALGLAELAQWQAPLPSLVDPALVRAVGRELASVTLPSSRIDVATLVKRASEAQQVLRLPTLTTSTVRFGVDLLVDVGAHVDMFMPDVHQLRALLRSIIGAELVRVLHFDRTPARAGAGPRKSWTQYRADGSPKRVLFLTRLDRAVDEEWLPLLRDMRAAGANPLALVPHEPERVSPALRKLLPIVEWDRAANVSTVRKLKEQLA